MAAITDFNLTVASSIVSDNGTTLSAKGSMVDGASAIGVQVGSTTTYSTTGAKLLSIVNNSSEKAYFTKDGGLVISGVSSGAALSLPTGTQINMGSTNLSETLTVITCGTTFASSRVQSRGGDTLELTGRIADGGSAIGVKIGNITSLATTGAKIVSFYSDNVSTEVAYVNKDGKIYSANYIEAAQSCRSNNGSFLVASGYPITLAGYAVDGASAVGAKITNTNALTTAGAKIAGFYSDGGTLQRAYVDKDGVLTGPVAAVGGVTVTAMTTPVNGTHTTATTGGTLADGTYYYRVAATNALGNTAASTETSIVVPPGTNTNTVTVKWGVVTGATGYKVYGRTTGAELLMATITDGNTSSWLDDGSVTPSGAISGAYQNAITIPLGSVMHLGNANRCIYDNNDGYWTLAAGFKALGVGNFTGAVYTTVGTYGNGDVTLEHRASKTDGGSAVAHSFDNTVTLSTTGAKLVSFKNGTVEKAYVDKDGDILPQADSIGTAAAGTGVTVNKSGVVRSRLISVTLSYTNFVTNGNTHDFTIWTIPARTKVVRLIADVTAAFTDGAGPITSIAMTAGKSAGGNEYLLSQDVLGGIGTYGDSEGELGTAVAGGIGDIPSWSGTTTVQARFTSDSAFGNGAVTNLTAGSCTFYLECVNY